MYWGIDRAEWLLLWSGVLGAVVSAAVAALVATFVLVRSNKHQLKLSLEAAETQRAVALKQLTEQRSEAARSREQAALAEVIVAVEQLVAMSPRPNGEVRSYSMAFKAAMARWRIELASSVMEVELRRWSRILTRKALGVSRAKESGNSENFRAALNGLEVAASGLMSVVLAWPAADGAERAALQERLSALRLGGETTTPLS